MVNHRRPLGIYVHIPFCVRKCLYCDFLSFPVATVKDAHCVCKDVAAMNGAVDAAAKARQMDEDATLNYVNLLLREIEQIAPGISDRYQVQSVFFGGGTPSILPVSCIEKILCKLKQCFFFEDDAEITIEVNPGTIVGVSDGMAQYRKIGINRISIGAQSLNDVELRKLGRIHSAQDFYDTFAAARRAGFENINVDLMTGIPGQTKASLEYTLSSVIALQPEHISAYSLIVEEGTPFEKLYPDGAVSEEEDRELYELTGKLLQGAGYQRYEISNYARPGKECRHNRSYWERTEYIGFGLGAASLLSETRFHVTRKFSTYQTAVEEIEEKRAAKKIAEEIPAAKEIAEETLAAKEMAEEMPAAKTSVENTDIFAWMQDMGLYEEWEALDRDAQISEAMFLGLRLTKGICISALEAKHQVHLDDLYGEVIAKHRSEGLLAIEDGYLHLTQQGLNLANYVMADFV